MRRSTAITLLLKSLTSRFFLSFTGKTIENMITNNITLRTYVSLLRVSYRRAVRAC